MQIGAITWRTGRSQSFDGFRMDLKHRGIFEKGCNILVCLCRETCEVGDIVKRLTDSTSVLLKYRENRMV